MKPGSPEWLQKKTEFLGIWTDVVGKLHAHAPSSPRPVGGVAKHPMNNPNTHSTYLGPAVGLGLFFPFFGFRAPSNPL